MKNEVCNFSKDSGKASGAVGVLTYDLFERRSNAAREVVAIMFSVPRDYNLYQNWLALGIYNQGKECDKKLYEEMYESKDQVSFLRKEANGCGLTYEGGNLDIKATMSPMGRAIMKVEIWDKLFSAPQHQGYH